MLESGKSYKVKVELEPGKIGYGRAAVVEKNAGRTYVHLKTSKENNTVLPTGSRLWFVSDSPTATLNGLWSCNVVGTKIFSGKTAMECGPLKFEPLTQRRKSQRVPLTCPVRLNGPPLSYGLRSRNVSRSGIGLEAYSQYVDEFPVGGDVDIVMGTPVGEVPIKCKVIRTEYNWLSNLTVIGLQYVSMSQEAVEILERLRNGSEQGEPVEGGSSLSTSLSGSLRTTRENLRLTKTRIEGRTNVASENDTVDVDSEDF
jgi:hypothetical protein